MVHSTRRGARNYRPQKTSNNHLDAKNWRSKGIPKLVDGNKRKVTQQTLEKCPKGLAVGGVIGAFLPLAIIVLGSLGAVWFFCMDTIWTMSPTAAVMRLS
ncbi:hypothetical protein KJE20_04861 [Pyrenophora tritici-repentis]|uniref:Uncharacterized protein n=1 Tax=Pyrenophora tritici-repentis TaxID=45151 RepID=A0A922SQ93_9PLEO|nr:hypothetical protein Ptr86124_011686 [Pyrenophora tritici-repentis]KAI1684577.1 hypothetical protein KJE20_04861 [Pyrenophora tritici-repentis]